MPKLVTVIRETLELLGAFLFIISGTAWDLCVDATIKNENRYRNLCLNGKALPLVHAMEFIAHHFPSFCRSLGVEEEEKVSQGSIMGRQ